MDPTRALVVCYSRSDTTWQVAHAIRKELGCDIERIVDTKPRHGVIGYLRSGFDALFHRPTVLRPLSNDPSNYDLVIVGTPIWNASVSAPVRAFLAEHRDRMKQVAFFCTYGGRGSARALHQMEEICGQKPVMTLAFRTDEVTHGAFDVKIRSFASALRTKPVSDLPPRVTNLRPVHA